MRYLRVTPLLLLLLLSSSCTDSDLQKVAKSLNILATTVGTLQTDVIAANEAKLLDDQTTGQILSVCTRVSVAGKQADAIVRTISKLDPQSRSSLVNLLTPISQALDPNALQFVAGVKNPETKQKIDGAFVILRSTISGLQIVLASSGGGS